MSGNMSDNYLRTFGYVLRRTNYGEADRILNIITPVGKIAAIARGVRKEKSKLAGGVEMFSLLDLNIHKGRGEFGIITGARMVKFYGEILKDLNLIEVASSFLKKINTAADSAESEEYFKILDESLEALNAGDNIKIIEAWFLLNLNKVMGEELNLYRDGNDQKLEAGVKYDWNFTENCFMKDNNGEFSENEIKALRLMTTNRFGVIKRIKMDDGVIGRVFELACRTSRM